MPVRGIDPARLEGEELTRWYLRTPEEIRRDREAEEAERHQAYFAPAPGDRVPDDGFTATRWQPSSLGDDDVIWLATGRGWRAVRAGSDPAGPLESPTELPYGPSSNSAAAETAALLDVVNPAHRRLRRQWEDAEGQAWPRTESGRNHDVAHRKAIADGGAHTLDNIRPMHPDEHRAEHMRNDDFGRWGRRPGTARAFGGRVEPPLHGPRFRGVNALAWLPTLLSLLTGGIRTDTWEHGMWDLAGFPAPDDWEPPKPPPII